MRALAVLVWIGLCAVTGIALFHVAFRVERLETKLSSLNTSILSEKEALEVLEAEWAYLNRPDRISRLSEKYLPDLVEADATQIVPISEIPEHAPFPVPGPSASPEIQALLAATREQEDGQ
ncbi:MAG: hypothetical protein RIM72_09740 [Alphaproteobacteria bacterium]